eukprot:scaffold125169_cov37-Cyclotella_meneghiniana.AAC.1
MEPKHGRRNRWTNHRCSIRRIRNSCNRSRLYYARAVDSTMLVALSAMAAEQGAPTEMKTCSKRLINSWTMQPHILKLRTPTTAPAT